MPMRPLGACGQPSRFREVNFPMAVLLSTYRDRVKLHENGYLYVFDKMSSNGQKKFWRCERKSECNARVHTDAVTNQVVKRSSEHNHPSNPSLVQTCAYRTIINPLMMSKECIEESLDSLTDQVNLTDQNELQTVSSLSTNDAFDSVFQLMKNQFPDESAATSLAADNGSEEMASPSKKRRREMKRSRSVDLDDPASFEPDQLSSPSSSRLEEVTVKRELPESDHSVHEESTAASAEIGRGSSNVTGVEDSVALNSMLTNKRSLPQPISMNADIQRFLSGGLVTWCPKISEILQLGELLVKMVGNSDSKNLASLLLKGAANSGKSCLAALIAKHSDIPVIRLCTPEDMIGFDDTAKSLAFCRIFEEAYGNRISIIIVDDIDRLIGYCAAGNQYSNMALQTLLILLKKPPPSNHRLVVIGTAEEHCARAFDLKSFFTTVAEVPCLTDIEHIIAVIEDSNIFNTSQRQILRQLLMEHHSNCSIGIKRLLDILELAKQCEPLQRVLFLYQRLKEFISS